MRELDLFTYANHREARDSCANLTWPRFQSDQEAKKMAAVAHGTNGINVKEEEWQVSQPTWKGRISYLYNNNIMSDITFKVKDEGFKAHKFVMASASSVFHAMFYGPVAETKAEIEIVDCPDDEDFSEFLKFVYTGELSLRWENLFQVAYLAKKYYIPLLTDECCKFLSESLTVENVLASFDQCVLKDENEMAKECMRLVRVTIRKLTKTEDFLKLNQQSLKFILASEILDIEELDLFSSVDKWCKYQLESQEKEVSPVAKRALLGDAINLLRFPTLSAKIFTNCCFPSGLITKDQFVDLVSFLMSEETDKHKNIDTKKIPFVATRRGRNNYSVVMKSDANVSQTYGSWFKFERKLWLKGITVAGQPILFCSINGNDGTYIRPDTSITVFTEGTKTYSHLIFKIPVEIQPNVGYNILCQYPMLCFDFERHLFGTGTTPKKSPWKPVPDCQPSVVPIQFSKPQLGRYSKEKWQKFHQLIYSEIDDQPIQEEEEVLFHGRCELGDP